MAISVTAPLSIQSSANRRGEVTSRPLKRCWERKRGTSAVPREVVSEGRATVQRAYNAQAAAFAEIGDVIVEGRAAVRTYTDRSLARTAASSHDRVADGSHVEPTGYHWTYMDRGRRFGICGTFVEACRCVRESSSLEDGFELCRERCWINIKDIVP